MEARKATMQPYSRAALPFRATWAAVFGILFLGVGPARGQSGSDTNVGYIDPSIPLNQYRVRFDASYDNNRPERVDFIYPAKNGLGPFREPRVDFQEFTNYFEYAPIERFSAFIEVPVRWINPEANANHYGFSDVNFGAKYAFLYGEDSVLTAQLRVYTPTGDSTRGLGTGHWTVEPALLGFRRLTDRLNLEAELRDWVPFGLSGSNAGNVVRYGVGLSYLAYDGANVRLYPVLETVAWTILSGLDERDGEIGTSASGETIVNAKIGLRTHFGEQGEKGWLTRAELYAGYGRALTGNVWYKDTFRVELVWRY